MRDSATNRVLVNKSNGYPLQGGLKDMGRTIPKHILGWGTNFRWKDLSLATNLEYRGGNVMFSQLGRDMTFTGSGKWTENRAPHVFPTADIMMLPVKLLRTQQLMYANLNMHCGLITIV